MNAKSERFELRLDENILEKIEHWRIAERDAPTKAETIRRLIERGLGTSPNDQAFLTMKFNILSASLITGPRERLSDAYIYAWDRHVFPLFHEHARWHEPFESYFRVRREELNELSSFLDECWGKEVPTFYELEKRYGVKRPGSSWDRIKLISALRYMYLSDMFDDKAFWKAIVKPMEHPSEASSIARKFNRDEDIYFH